LRRDEGLTQAAMAKRLGISASYLNLIEHNHRPLTAALLLELARVFQIDLASFSEDDQARLYEDLMEAFADDLFTDSGLKAADVQGLLDASPEVGRAVSSLYRAYRSALDDRRALVERVSDMDEAMEAEPARLPSEEVSDFLQEHRNHFASLEQGADALVAAAAARHGQLLTGLGRHLERRHGVSIEVVPADESGGAVRVFDPESRKLVLSEVLPPRSRLFQLAHQLTLLELHDELNALVQNSPTLVSSDGRALARVALANYTAGAVLMPYGPFVEAARSLRYDIEVLGHRFRTSFEQICHRLTTLGRPGDEGVPFHMVRVDIAGNISKRFSASGIRFARYSGACPRWNVHAAFMQPGFIRTQLSHMPDGTTYFCIARTVRREGGGFRVPQSRLAIGLGCGVEHARDLVYADGVELDNLGASVPIGPTCRLCERSDCRQRAFPPLQQRLNVDENVRSLCFYQAPAVPRDLG